MRCLSVGEPLPRQAILTTTTATAPVPASSDNDNDDCRCRHHPQQSDDDDCNQLLAPASPNADVDDDGHHPLAQPHPTRRQQPLALAPPNTAADDSDFQCGLDDSE